MDFRKGALRVLIRQAERLLIIAQSPRSLACFILLMEVAHNLHRFIPGSNMWLADRAPWLLLTLSPAQENTVAAASIMSIWAFVGIGVLRRAVPKLVWYMVGVRGLTFSGGSESRFSKLSKKLSDGITHASESTGWFLRGYRWLGYVRVDKIWIVMMARRGWRLSVLVPWVLVMVTVEVVGWYYAGQWLRPHINTLNTIATTVAVCYLLTVVANWAAVRYVPMTIWLRFYA